MGSPAAPSSSAFRDPPLEEVALAVQFQPLAVDTMAAAALYAQLRTDFPAREEQPSRPPIAEEFPTEPQPPFRFEIIAAPAMPRFWFLSESRARLVQLQADLLAYNWRRSAEGVATDESYPRYDQLRAEIEAHLARLAETVEGDLLPNWCEVTYVNHVGPLPGSAGRPRLDQLVRGIEAPWPTGALPEPTDVGLNLRFTIPGDDGPRGRLSVTLATAIRTTDGLPIWVMTLTARLRAEEETLPAALNALDMGHEWAENGFLELTSDEMQRHWGRE